MCFELYGLLALSLLVQRGGQQPRLFLVTILPIERFSDCLGRHCCRCIACSLQDSSLVCGFVLISLFTLGLQGAILEPARLRLLLPVVWHSRQITQPQSCILRGRIYLFKLLLLFLLLQSYLVYGLGRIGRLWILLRFATALLLRLLILLRSAPVTLTLPVL